MKKLLAGLIVLPALCVAGELKPVELPAAQTDGGKPLMQVLKERKSSREFSATRLPPQELSNLLWAAFGVNRADGKRTAPSAMDRQEIDIYVVTAEGLYLYEPNAHRLTPLLSGDLRASTGTQAFVRDAAVNLVYVADFGKLGNMPAEDKVFYSAANTGFIGQNVYLYCASAGLATVVRGSVDRTALAKTMRLRPDQRIVLAQSVGYPK
ncbi:MAG: SagB/ThcOx family dehydrogenase [Acidobacteriia bacterium]|nr:SagB/ThcOx family dehydrogenase [Terriglobia bacterium]